MKMGCPLTKFHFECPRPNPRIFQVWNIDSEGHDVKPGKIEITDAQLILYQKGDITVRWPLRSLRRYGFDAELFSFECGRRCSTGPGVYAFRCRRAEALFNLLQEHIQNSGGTTGNTSVSSIDEQMNLESNVIPVEPAPAGPNFFNGSANNHRVISGVDSAGYLEPISRGSNFPVQCPQPSNRSSQILQSVSTTQNSTAGGTVCSHPAGRSCGNSSVVWSSQLTPNLPTTCSLPTSCGCPSAWSLPAGCSIPTTHHNYVNDVGEHVVSTTVYPAGLCMVHDYVNSSEFDHSARLCPSQSWLGQGRNAYVNSPLGTLHTLPPPPPISIQPGSCQCAISCVDINTNYAKLDDLLKQEQSAKRFKEEEEEEEAHCYVNVKPLQQSQKNPGSLTGNNCLSDGSKPLDLHLERPATISDSSVRPKTHSSHLYVNLRSTSIKNSVPDTGEVGDNSPKMHYAILDLDQNSESQGSGSNTSSTVSQTSAYLTKGKHSVVSILSRTREAYAQIDFDRTVALSNSANPCPHNDESVRKTRHNATKPKSSTSC